MHIPKHAFSGTVVSCPDNESYTKAIDLLRWLDNARWGLGGQIDKYSYAAFENGYSTEACLSISDIESISKASRDHYKQNGFKIISVDDFRERVKDAVQAETLIPDNYSIFGSCYVGPLHHRDYIIVTDLLNQIKGAIWRGASAGMLNVKDLYYHKLVPKNTVPHIDVTDLKGLMYVDNDYILDHPLSIIDTLGFSNIFNNLIISGKLSRSTKSNTPTPTNQSYKCMECKDTGEYIGLFERENCKSCNAGGKTNAV